MTKAEKNSTFEIYQIYTAYGLVFICFIVYLTMFYGYKLPEATEPSVLNDTSVYSALIDQLKRNLDGYANNVWKTLATLIGVIGLVLGSAKFKEMISSKPKYLTIIQALVFGLFVIHSIAYGMYANANKVIILQLGDVTKHLEYYEHYRLSSNQLGLNLFFDLALFILLAYILNHLKHKKAGF